MIRTISIIFSLSLFSVSAMPQNTGNQLNFTDSKGLKQGKWKKNYEGTDKIRYEGQFVNNIPTGKFTYYHPIGSVQSTLYHRSNGFSACEMFLESGIRIAHGNYFEQTKDSTWTYYSEYGDKLAEEHYVKGVAYGNWKKYYANGQVLEEVYYENNFENGPFKQYYENGIVSREAKYVKGSIEGSSAFYHENGMLRFEGIYVRDAKEGLWKSYDDKGNLIDERRYTKGVPEYRESDLIQEDTNTYIIKDGMLPEDFFDEDFTEIPSKDNKSPEKKSKNGR